MNRVVITGMGWITPLGHGIEPVWKRLLAGESGIARTSLFDAATFPTSISAEVKDYRLSDHIGEAAEILRRGDADVMLGGGAHSMIHPFGVTGFNRLTALSTANEIPPKASRPFDAQRGGFVLGEGAGMVILETLDHAKARNAPILAEIVG